MQAIYISPGKMFGEKLMRRSHAKSKLREREPETARIQLPRVGEKRRRRRVGEQK